MKNRGRHRGIRGKWLLAKALKQQHFEIVVHFPHSFESAWISFFERYPGPGRVRHGRTGTAVDPGQTPSPGIQ